VPFEIKRIYYIYDLANENAIRGKHAHKTLEQVIFCINGSFLLALDDGINKQEVVLDQPNCGVYLGTYLWHTMTRFSKECVLLVLASDFFSEADYIRDYEKFLKMVRKKE
jgi:dTDP-4-dehydrorhamnose 3,5-epimerase-like enzyme